MQKLIYHRPITKKANANALNYPGMTPPVNNYSAPNRQNYSTLPDADVPRGSNPVIDQPLNTGKKGVKQRLAEGFEKINPFKKQVVEGSNDFSGHIESGSEPLNKKVKYKQPSKKEVADSERVFNERVAKRQANQSKIFPSSKAAPEAPKVDVPPPPPPVQEKSFRQALSDTFNKKNPLGKYQAGWETGVQSFGGTLKKGISESLTNYAAKNPVPQTGLKGMAFKAVGGALKDGGVFDKAVGVVAKHGLKAPMAAGLAGGALVGGKLLAGAVGRHAGWAVPVGLSIAAGFAKDKGMKGLSKGLGMAGETAKKVMTKENSLSNEDRYILMKLANSNDRYIPDGFEPIEETDMTKQAAKLPPIKAEADLMDFLADVPAEVRERIWYGMSQLKKRDALQKTRDFAITSTLGITGGVASNVLTDKYRQKSGNPNQPVIVVANNKVQARKVLDKMKKEGSTVSTAIESLKNAQSKDFISHALENVQKFTKNNPKLTPYLLGIATPFVAPYAIDSTTRLIGEGQRFATAQYNNLNYGYGAPGYSPYMSNYGGAYGIY